MAKYYRTIKKKKKNPYGEELLVNGSFSNTTGWTFNKSSTTISGGVLNYSAAENLEFASNSATITSGTTYRVSYTVLTGSARLLFYRISGGAGSIFDGGLLNTVIKGPGAYEYIVNATRTTALGFYIYNTSPGTAFTIDDFSLKEVL
jgi:hypothetical protein